MAVEVADHLDLPLLGELLDHLLGSVQRRVQLLINLLPAAIQIGARQRGPVVPMDNPIRVHHRDNLKDDVIPQVFRHRVRRRQEVDHPLHDLGAHGLARVLPREDHDTEPLLALLKTAGGCDCQDLALVLGDGLAKRLEREIPKRVK